jgi:SAM-dependent methyltransferase
MDAITRENVERILAVPHFGGSHYASWNINKIYQSYLLLFADLLGTYERGRPVSTVADIGAGYGWLSFALAARTDARIIAIEMNEPRLVAARQIAEILGVADRIDWRVGALPNLPLGDQEADVSFCVEVIEHAGDQPEVVEELGRVTRDLLVVTSPNKLFPIIKHDTKLPFCHWLSLKMRDRYAALFNRLSMQDNNLFWTPNGVSAALPDFERISAFLQFPSYQDYAAAERKLGGNASGSSELFRQAREAFFRTASLAGKNAVYILPNLASAYRRVRNQLAEDAPAQTDEVPALTPAA